MHLPLEDVADPGDGPVRHARLPAVADDAAHLRAARRGDRDQDLLGRQPLRERRHLFDRPHDLDAVNAPRALGRVVVDDPDDAVRGPRVLAQLSQQAVGRVPGADDQHRTPRRLRCAALAPLHEQAPGQPRGGDRADREEREEDEDRARETPQPVREDHGRDQQRRAVGAAADDREQVPRARVADEAAVDAGEEHPGEPRKHRERQRGGEHARERRRPEGLQPRDEGQVEAQREDPGVEKQQQDAPGGEQQRHHPVHSNPPSPCGTTQGERRPRAPPARRPRAAGSTSARRGLSR